MFFDILGLIYFGIGRKYPKLVLDGFDYSKEKSYGDSTSWVCPSYFKTKCKARLITKGNMVYVRNGHNHTSKDRSLLNMSSKLVTIIRKS